MSQVQENVNWEARQYQLRRMLGELKLRTKEGRRFAKREYLVSRRIDKPIDVVGVFTYEFKMDLKMEDLVAVARDVVDVLNTWFTWLYYTAFLTCDLGKARIKEVDNLAVTITADVCIENRVWEFELVLNGLKVWPDVWGFYIRR